MAKTRKLATHSFLRTQNARLCSYLSDIMTATHTRLALG
jgi:hypothetical protein